MPIYEFRCKKCKNIFESLIFSSGEEKNFFVPNVDQKSHRRSCPYLPEASPIVLPVHQLPVPQDVPVIK